MRGWKIFPGSMDVFRELIRKCELAARNNAVWCESVCRAHGIPGEFHSTVWLNRHTPPPYYSNLIVLYAAGDPDEKIRTIQELVDLPLPGHWTVKDSFAQLELGPLGFETLFEATWIWRELGLPIPGNSPSGLRWSRITNPVELSLWESAWADNSKNNKATGKPMQFPHSLLADPQIAFFAGRQGQEILAGGIANCTGEVVGVSNIFVNFGELLPAWHHLLACFQETFPGLSLVGYEWGDSLAAALAGGFQPIGQLKVWIRKEAV